VKYPVSIIKCDKYELSEVERSIEKSINLIGNLKDFIHKGDKVLLKPNMLSPKEPDKACTTHPIFLKAVIRIIKKAGGIPSVGDSPAIHTANRVASASGIARICKEENVQLIELKTPFKIKNPNGKIIKSFVVAKEITQFDKIINLPKLKTHSLTLITVGVKNLFGVIPGIRKGKYHFRFQDPYRFSQMLVDLNMVVKPTLTIVDGIVGMEGEGPAAGNPKQIGVIIAGTDTVAIDYVSSIVINYNPLDIPTIQAAREVKLGGYSFELIDTKGVNIKDVIVKNFKTLTPKKSHSLIVQAISVLGKNLFLKKPVIQKKICIGCGECSKICPAQTIKIVNGKAVINYDNCIRCYCCFEICRYNAIKLKGLV